MKTKLFDKNHLLHLDKTILALYFVFVCIGILFIHSVSRYAGAIIGLENNVLLFKQTVFSIISISSMFFFAQLDYRVTRAIVKPLIMLSIILLIMVFIPGIGLEIGVARRWINFRFFSFNPSEFAKLALTIYLAHILVKKQNIISNFTFGLLPPLLLASLMFLIILLQSGFSIGVIIITVLFSMIFIGGAALKHLFSIAILTTPVLIIAIQSVSYRRDRIAAYLDPWVDPNGIGYQSIQSLQALANGGLFGKGLGNSIQKISRLPAAHTDFIFSIIVEETGFLGGLALIGAFVLFFIQGLKLAFRVKDKYAQLLSFGITTLISSHALLNIMIATALVPPTGVSLPFISYGGSSYLVLSIAVGILLNISAQTNEVESTLTTSKFDH